MGKCIDFYDLLEKKKKKKACILVRDKIDGNFKSKQHFSSFPFALFVAFLIALCCAAGTQRKLGGAFLYKSYIKHVGIEICARDKSTSRMWQERSTLVSRPGCATAVSLQML